MALPAFFEMDFEFGFGAVNLIVFFLLLPKLIFDLFFLKGNSVPVDGKTIMEEKGFPIARRTVAKYREQMGIPVARMRK